MHHEVLYCEASCMVHQQPSVVSCVDVHRSSVTERSVPVGEVQGEVEEI